MQGNKMSQQKNRLLGAMGPSKSQRKPLIWILIITVALALIECIAILTLNTGVMTLAIDDPYIHFALGNRLLEGHYGINAHEYAAPASSIVWPFLICLLTLSDSALPYTTVAINVALTMGVMCILWMALTSKNTQAQGRSSETHQRTFVILLACLLGSNLLTLAFTGLEHNLQTFVTSAMVFGMLKHADDQKVRWWWLASIIIAPLVRYECAAFSFACLAYLALQGRPLVAVLVGAMTVSPLVAFSGFLLNMGLDFLPSSVLVKTNLHAGHSSLSTATHNLLANITSVKGQIVSAGIACVLTYALQSSTPKRHRMAALALAAAATGHMVGAQLGFRYESHVWASIMLLILFTQRGVLYTPLPLKVKPNLNKQGAMALFSITIIAICSVRFSPYLIITPLAANNIYKQQYQMRRFVFEYFKAPVAVNDLGYVSYKNDFDVLDLWGLGSLEAAKARGGNEPDWMEKITAKHKVQLAMIYESWFTPNTPKSWMRIADLKLKRIPPSQIIKVGSAGDDVSFYATDCQTAQDTMAKLAAFQKTLPTGSTLDIHPEPAAACATSATQMAAHEVN
jgi:hypothetical protein